MQAPLLSVSRRTRRTPFTDRVEAAGVQAYTVYNHMLLPTVFESLEADAAHLKRHVQLWDVSCQRQIEVRGPDATRLVELCTPREISSMDTGQCRYSPIVDEGGRMLNDPVVIKPDADRYWVSIADTDIGLWMDGLARGMGLAAEVEEADVWPLAVQGPRAEALMQRVFGEGVRGIRFFRCGRVAVADHPLRVSRSGFSKQGGFEIYLDRAELAEPLWDTLLEAGRDLQVRAGGPNLIERIESGLLSYGNDMTRANTPYECGLGALCRLDKELRCIATDALRAEAERGPRRSLTGLRIDGGPVPVCREPWRVTANGTRAGSVTSAAWSPDCGTNVAIGMLECGHGEPGTRVRVEAPGGSRSATVCHLPHRG